MEKIDKLHEVVVREGLYTKSLYEFKKKYSNKESIDKLYDVLIDEGLYTKGKYDFYAKYFPDLKKEQVMNLPTKDKIKLLYDVVSKEYDLGTYGEFKVKLKSPEKRKVFYNTVTKKYDLGSFEEFESIILSQEYYQFENGTSGEKTTIASPSFWTTQGTEILTYTGGIFLLALIFFLIYRFRSKIAALLVSHIKSIKAFVVALVLAILTGFLFKVPKLAAYRTYEVEVLRNQDFFDVSHYFVFNYTYAIGVFVLVFIVTIQILNWNAFKKHN
jgi:hypothetical protein